MKSQHKNNGPIPTVATVAWLLLVLWLIQGCAPSAPPEVAEDDVPPRSAEIVDTQSEPQATDTDMVLQSRQSRTEYSPRPEPFTPPDSLDDVEEPAGGSWEGIQPGHEVDFHNYDNVRVLDQGEAVLDLGDFMHLLLKCEAVIQSEDSQLAVQKWEEIRIEAVDTPALQKLILNIHLMRGGFSGTLEPGHGPVALTTPNAVIIVSGTTFFVTYDPAVKRTWVGNIEGTIHIGDVPANEKVGLDDQRLIAIPPFQGARFFDLPSGLNEDSFAQLVGLTGSPRAAAVAFTGPLLIVRSGSERPIWSEPSQQSEQLGLLPRGAIAPIQSHVNAQDGGYWQIICPTGIDSRQGCWVSDNPDAVDTFNVRDIPEQPSTDDRDRDRDGVNNDEDYCPDEPAGDTPHLDRPGCPAIDPDGDGWYNHDDECPDEPAGRFPDPNRPGCPNPDPDRDGYPANEDQCLDEPAGNYPDPARSGCPAIDSDQDGLFDYEDECWDVPQGEFPDPARPGCPVVDLDRDGVLDEFDLCREDSQGENPDPTRPGCPAVDRDKDGWFDFEDECSDEPAEVYPDVFPDPDRPGCPALDADGDGWLDYEDLCPDEPAGGFPDPVREGCPYLWPDLMPVNPNPNLGGLGYCRLDGGQLVVTIRNLGKGDAPNSEVVVTFFTESGESETASANTGPIPAGGTSAPLYFKIPGLCFNPDCDFNIAVDQNNDVYETDEKNNYAEGWCLG